MSRKRPLAVLLAVLLLAAPGARGTSYEDLDEEVLAAQERATATPDPAATPVPPEQVYAISDVDNPGEEGETRIEEGTRPDFVEKLLEKPSPRKYPAPRCFLLLPPEYR